MRLFWRNLRKRRFFSPETVDTPGRVCYDRDNQQIATKLCTIYNQHGRGAEVNSTCPNKAAAGAGKGVAAEAGVFLPGNVRLGRRRRCGGLSHQVKRYHSCCRRGSSLRCAVVPRECRTAVLFLQAGAGRRR
ncbi:MAG: hypothetical protein DBX44_00365 [Oscillospiraceae bacterium]|nr:MAG: hypothetical protein DBX44_00365 [Oscillospiraceae bacterium]